MPKNKKQSSSDSDSGPDDRNPPPSKKSKAKDATDADGGKSDAGGQNVWVLEKLRRVQINEFRGRKSIDIREYYEKDGKQLPGKKGISLSLSQWKKLLEVADEVTKAATD